MYIETVEKLTDAIDTLKKVLLEGVIEESPNLDENEIKLIAAFNRVADSTTKALKEEAHMLTGINEKLDRLLVKKEN